MITGTGAYWSSSNKNQKKATKVNLRFDDKTYELTLINRDSSNEKVLRVASRKLLIVWGAVEIPFLVMFTNAKLQ
jgi:hypothetical protein